MTRADRLQVLRERTKAWTRKHPRYRAEWRKSHPEIERWYHLGREYGLVPGEYETMLASQCGRCAICTQPATHVDHDHKTGKVRALLCHKCNVVLGMADDSLPLIRAAADYLEFYEHTNGA